MEYKSKRDIIRSFIGPETTLEDLYSMYDNFCCKVAECSVFRPVPLCEYRRYCRIVLTARVKPDFETIKVNKTEQPVDEKCIEVDKFDVSNMDVIKAWGKPGDYRYSLKKGVTGISVDEIVADVKSQLAELKFNTINYIPTKQKLMYEISIIDQHYGALILGEKEIIYDLKISREMMLDAVNTLMTYIKHLEIERILFPLGNDFFNTDNSTYTTTAGTRQDETPSWKLTFIEGRRLIMDVIELLKQTAPVDIIVAPGNHDKTKMFYLGHLLDIVYTNDRCVTVDNNFNPRKYYQYGTNMIGVTHGKSERKGSLPMLMALEAPQMWADTKYREFQHGHLHHEATKATYLTKENMSVREVLLSALVPGNDWHKESGYISLQQSSSRLYHAEKGHIGGFNYNVL